MTFKIKGAKLHKSVEFCIKTFCVLGQPHQNVIIM